MTNYVPTFSTIQTTMNLFDLDNVSSSSESVSDEEDIRNPFERYGYAVNHRRMGSHTNYDTYSMGTIFDLNMSRQVFFESVLYAINRHLNSFRNLVLSFSISEFLARNISISRSRILEHGDTIEEGLEEILTHFDDNDFYEVFNEDDYEFDSERHFGVYGVYPDSMQTLYTIFSIAYDDNVNLFSGGVILTCIPLENLEVINIPQSGNFNYFFDCVKYYFPDIKLDVQRIRQKLRIPTGEISIRHIKKFEKYVDVKFVVYMDRIDEEGNLIKLYNSNVTKTHEVKLVLANNHYYVYKGPKRIITTNIETNIKTNFSYLFYDFEIYVDNRTGQLKPYAMSYNFVSNDNKESGVILKNNIEDDIEKRIAEFFMKYLDNHAVCLVGFNNSAFDDYILIDILSSYFKKLSKVLLDSRSRILSAVYNNKFFTKDLCRFLMTSLRKATKNFKCDINKKSLDHRQVQDHVDNGTFTQYVDSNRDSIIEYSLYDVLSLTELYFKVSKAFLKINENMSIGSCVTLSHMAMNAYKKYLMSLRDTFRPMSLPIASTFEYDENIRKAMIGGRCQIFNSMEEKDCYVQSIDVVSLYPFVMMNKEFPYFPETYAGHKVWKKSSDKEWFIATNVFVENKFGIYEAEILSQPFDKVVPRRNDDNTWDWSCERRFKCWIDDVTLRCLRRHGGSFKVISGYYFDLPRDKIFSSFLEPMMKEKCVKMNIMLRVQQILILL